MRVKSFLILVIVLALKASAGDLKAGEEKSQQKSAVQNMIAVQISYLEQESPEEVSQWFKSLKSAGVDTIIFKAFHNPDDSLHKLCKPNEKAGFYFQTGSAPLVCDITRTVAQIAHKNGLKFYAWINTRSADYGIEQRTDLKSLEYDPKTDAYHPGKNLCVFHPEVLSRLLNITADLAKNPIDGVLIQDDLILKYNEDFHPLAFHLYLKEQGKTSSPDLFYVISEDAGGKRVKDYTPEFWEWSEWKAKKLLDIADEMRRVIRDKGRGAKFGLNFYYEAALKPEKGKLWFSQDLKMAKERGYDFYVLMLYHRQIGEELGISGEELDSAIKISATNFLSLIPPDFNPLIKLMTIDFKSKEQIPLNELKRITGLIPEKNRISVAFFPARPEMSEDISQMISDWRGIK